MIQRGVTGAYMRLVAQKIPCDMERRELMSAAVRERLHIIVRILEVSTSEDWFLGVCRRVPDLAGGKSSAYPKRCLLFVCI